MTLAFHREPDAMDELLSEAAVDGLHENGLDVWQPVTGVRFFIPSLDVLTGLRQEVSG